jgi:hypothetical protein
VRPNIIARFMDRSLMGSVFAVRDVTRSFTVAIAGVQRMAVILYGK